MTSDRDALRQSLRERRRALPAATRIAAADALASHLLALPCAPTSGDVAGYWALDGEIGLHRWQLSLPPGVRYCLPVLHGKLLRFAPWRPRRALAGQPLRHPRARHRAGFARCRPTRCSWWSHRCWSVSTPMAAGLAWGGGWYDRSFAFRIAQAAPPWLVGVGFEVQRVPLLDAEAWDVPLDAICTEHTTHLCTNAPA